MLFIEQMAGRFYQVFYNIDADEIIVCKGVTFCKIEKEFHH